MSADDKTVPQPRLIAWEITRACNLSCIHCRASAIDKRNPDELTSEECLRLVDEIASEYRPIIILTGGEPLLRDDVFDISSRATAAGLRVVMATNGTLLTDEIAARAVASGIKRISVSIDGANSDSHDAFRKVPGAFEGSLRGIEAAKAAGLAFQLNMSVVKANRDELPAIMKLAEELGAAALHVFLLVPTGRGRELEELTAEDYEETLFWLHQQRKNPEVPIEIQVTCAPHYARIERAEPIPGARPSSGCMGGQSFCFISHVGTLAPCGYLEVDCGNVREEGFLAAWKNSTVFRQLRDRSQYWGKCGVCEFVRVCGGCRARAYAATGDFLAAEPMCSYRPKKQEKKET